MLSGRGVETLSVNKQAPRRKLEPTYNLGPIIMQDATMTPAAVLHQTLPPIHELQHLRSPGNLSPERKNKSGPRRGGRKSGMRVKQLRGWNCCTVCGIASPEIRKKHCGRVTEFTCNICPASLKHRSYNSWADHVKRLHPEADPSTADAVRARNCQRCQDRLIAMPTTELDGMITLSTLYKMIVQDGCDGDREANTRAYERVSELLQDVAANEMKRMRSGSPPVTPPGTPPPE